MRPIAKNIIVVDELGNEYTSTYAKRAEGLVKKGRAHWKDGNTICLVCPPDKLDLEEHNMNNKAETMNTIDAVCENKETERMEESVLTVADILSRIDAIVAQGEQLQDAITQIQNIPVNEGPTGGYDGQGRADAIRMMYIAHETTNQQIVELLNRMYNDIAPKNSNNNAKEVIAETISKMNFAGVDAEVVEAMLEFLNN